MVHNHLSRRKVLGGIAASGIGFVGVGAVSAEEQVDYIVTGGNPNQVENAIERGAEGSGRGDPETGAGRINALDTVRLLQ